MKSSYLYQTIHTMSHHPLHMAAHCRAMERDFLDLYLRPLTLDEGEISERVTSLLRESGATEELSVFVELRVDVDQEWEVVIDSVSLYNGYAMRSIQPVAQPLIIDSPFGLLPTTARRATLSLAHDMARNLGGEIVLECGADSRLLSIDGATIFGVCRGEVIASTTLRRVERELIIRAAQTLGVRVEERDIFRSELGELDELFGCDHRGIVTISKCGHYSYMSVVASKIANALARPW